MGFKRKFRGHGWQVRLFGLTCIDQVMSVHVQQNVAQNDQI